MVRHISIIIAILGLIASPNHQAQAQSREFYIIQNKVVTPIKNHQVVLKKEPFALYIKLKDMDYVHINISIDSNNLDSMLNGIPFEDLYCFRPGSGMADYRYNKMRSLLINESDNSYWGLNAKSSQSDFNSHIVVGKWVICERIVENMQVLDPENKGEYKVDEFPFDRLYLIFKVYYDGKKGKRESTDFDYFEIVFTDNSL